MKVTYKLIKGSQWQKVETYVYSSATYVIACPADRRCQVGMGVYLFGQPRGEKIRFSGEKKITVVGAGALHVRVDDGLGPCKIGLSQESGNPISWTWDI